MVLGGLELVLIPIAKAALGKAVVVPIAKAALGKAVVVPIAKAALGKTVVAKLCVSGTAGGLKTIVAQEAVKNLAGHALEQGLSNLAQSALQSAGQEAVENTLDYIVDK